MRRTFTASAVVLTALLASVGFISPVQAATPIWNYYSTSGGTQAKLIGSLVTTDLTGASNLGGAQFSDSRTNAVAGVSVPGLLEVGAITSSQVVTPFQDGIEVTSKAKVAGIDLLSGAIKLDAVEVTNKVQAVPGNFSNSFDSKLLNLTIAGKSYPLSAQPNTKIGIPGLAEVTLNEQTVNKGASGIQTKIVALKVTLLKDFGGAKLGSTIELTPSNVTVVSADGSQVGVPVGGFAYGSAVIAGAGNIRANVPPTALLNIPSIGTAGKTFSNSTATVNAGKVLNLGVVETQINATSAVGFSDAFAQAQIARINLLNGAVTADAIKVKSKVMKTLEGNTQEQSMDFINLKVAGKVIPINVKPNTSINVLGLGVVYLNQQLSAPGYSAIVGVRVIVGTKALGLPVGADVQLGVASTYTARS